MLVSNIRNRKILAILRAQNKLKDFVSTLARLLLIS